MLSDALLQLLPKILVVVLNERIFFLAGLEETLVHVERAAAEILANGGCIAGSSS